MLTVLSGDKRAQGTSIKRISDKCEWSYQIIFTNTHISLSPVVRVWAGVVLCVGVWRLNTGWRRMMEEPLQMSGERRLVINYGDATIGAPQHSFVMVALAHRRICNIWPFSANFIGMLKDEKKLRVPDARKPDIRFAPGAGCHLLTADR